MTRHLAGWLEIELVSGDLSSEEHARADELHEAKYSRPEWRFPPRSELQLRGPVCFSIATQSVETRKVPL